MCIVCWPGLNTYLLELLQLVYTRLGPLCLQNCFFFEILLNIVVVLEASLNYLSFSVGNVVLPEASMKRLMLPIKMRWNRGPQRVQKIPLNASGRAASTSQMQCGSKAHPVMQISQQKSSEIIRLGNMFQCFGLNKLALERWKENTRAQTQHTLCLTSAFLMFFSPLNQFKVCFSFHPRPSSALTCCNFSCIWKQTQR